MSPGWGSKMRALVIKQLGDPTLPLSPSGPLSLSTQTATPPMTPNGVRIRVTAAALNFADALQVKVRHAYTMCGGPAMLAQCSI